MSISRVGSTHLFGSSKVHKKRDRKISKLLERIATGRRINRASDDAAGLAVVQHLETYDRGFKMVSRSISDAQSALNIADSASQQVSELLQRQRELALAARNDTLTDTDRNTLQTEYQNLTDEISRIAENAQFNTKKTNNGTDLASGNAQIQVGPESGDTFTMPFIDIQATTLEIKDTSVDTAQNANTAISALDQALGQINAARSTAGSTTNALERLTNNAEIMNVNTTAAKSALQDQDIALGLVHLTREQLLQETGNRAFKRFQDISANHMLGLLLS